jgi:NhaP-type Na+/H+ or K+/H+ antiporter
MIPKAHSSQRRAGCTLRLTVLILFLLLLQWTAAAAATTKNNNRPRILSEIDEEEHEIEPADYILFPFFVQAIGIVVFYLTTYILEHVVPLPYTALMFMIGMAMGIGVQKDNTLESYHNSSMARSILGWADIDSELLFLTFLPGLLFWDSLNTHRYLFYRGVSQIMVLAFPAVLAGTFLTALVFYYVFPYGWSFSLSMTVGSILSATDPVAVVALLAEVGAPPRLQLLISGESVDFD